MTINRGRNGAKGGARVPGVKPPRLAQAPGEVRIIGGLWRGIKLPVVFAEGLRPTPDRVRETLFNWLGQHLHGQQCLDLFAGTGALGFEAASRGASHVVLVEQQASVLQALQRASQRLPGASLTILGASALNALARLQAQGQRFDVVFLDPPFAAAVSDPSATSTEADLLSKCLQALPPLLAPQAKVYVEAPRLLDRATLGDHWEIYRHQKAGQVHAHLMLQCNIEGEKQTI